jgi:hypothetical protein
MKPISNSTLQMSDLSDIRQRFGDRQKFVAREVSLTIREEEMAVADF